MCADADVQKMQENRKKREDMCMQKNDTVVVEITDIGVNGEGIGKIDGYTLFIKDAVIGDVAEVKVIKAKKNYGYARLINVLEPSNSRVEPKCPFARKCGGCQIQEMSYEKQLEFKEKSGEILNGSAVFHLNFWNVQKSRSLGWKLRFIIEIRRSFRLEQTKKEIP